MLIRIIILSWALVLPLSLSNSSLAQAQSVATNGGGGQKLKSFLSACGMGVGAGAALGVASLAFVSDPGSNIQNVAKGASLGLYAGILWGYYNILVTQETPVNSEVNRPQKSDDSLWVVQPDFHRDQVDGAQVGYLISTP